MADRPAFIDAIVRWLRSGYPQGVPDRDYVPLFALLRRQVSEDEAQEIAKQLAAGTPRGESVSRVDAGVEITKVTEELPGEADISRVRQHLEEHGWPFDDEPLRTDGTLPRADTTDTSDPTHRSNTSEADEGPAE